LFAYTCTFCWLAVAGCFEKGIDEWRRRGRDREKGE
jgi:hypothetical protein